MFNLTVDEAHTFYVGQNGWLVHNGCGPTAMQLSVEARIAQQALARAGLGKSVVATGWDYNAGKMVYSVSHSDPSLNAAAVNYLRQLGYDVVDAASKSTPEFHAERLLDAKGFDIIGVSRAGDPSDLSLVAGLCSRGSASCQSYFANKPYTSIASFKPEYWSLPRFKW